MSRRRDMLFGELWPRRPSTEPLEASSTSALKELMTTVAVVLDREVAEQLVKRLKNPYQIRVGRETAFLRLLAALESALKAG